GNALLADFASHSVQQGRQIVTVTSDDIGRKIDGRAEFHREDEFSKSSFLANHAGRRATGLVLFPRKSLSRRDQALFDAAIEMAHEWHVECVCIVSSFEVHLGDRQAARAEAFLLRSVRGLSARIVVLRPSHVLSANSRLGRLLKSWWFAFPLVP